MFWASATDDSPSNQRRRMERPREAVTGRQPASSFPSQIKRHRIHRFVIRQTVQRLQGDHRSHDIGRHARAAPPRREQIREHLVWEQLAPIPDRNPNTLPGLRRCPATDSASNNSR